MACGPPANLPSVKSFDPEDSARGFFDTARGGPQWNDFDDDDELPLGRNTLKARSRDIVTTKRQGPSAGPTLLGPALGIENNGGHSQNFPRPQPPSAYPPPGGTGYPGFTSLQQQPPPAMTKPPHGHSLMAPPSSQPQSMMPPSSQPKPPAGGWKIDEDMMNQPWGAWRLIGGVERTWLLETSFIR